MSHPELSSEQAYVDRAYEHLERMRDAVAGAGDRVDGEVAQAAMDAWAAKRLRTFEDAEQGLCFGRLDFEQVPRPLYVGRRWVHDEERRQVVVNWQAPAARPFYTATPVDPHGVSLRRRFRTDGRRVLDIADESLDGTILDGAAVGDFLLEELERNRDVHMRDIVATIQTDQYRLITAEPTPPLVIQGGPGHRQDRRRPAPRLVPALHAPRHPGAPRRPRDRPEPDVHGVRLARAAGARRERGRAARGLGARRRRRAASCATRRRSRC